MKATMSETLEPNPHIDDNTKPPVGSTSATSPPQKEGIFARTLKFGETGFPFVKSLTVFGFVGTLIGAYFQNISTYEDKVSALAKEDLAAATLIFKDAASALSIPLSLQERLVSSYYDAVERGRDTDPNTSELRSAHALAAAYGEAYTSLREKINLLAHEAASYLDWPSDPKHDPAKAISPTADPIHASSLAAYHFSCEEHMPDFDKPGSLQDLKNDDGRVIKLDWFSAKHHIYTIYSCFNRVHYLMKPVRDWISNTPVDATEKADLLERKALILNRLNNQVVRFNSFVGLAMNEIEQIRVRYRPGGFLCSLPGVREISGKKCDPISTS
jgi:hypothetical protein